jgi:hypothetical protein
MIMPSTLLDQMRDLLPVCMSAYICILCQFEQPRAAFEVDDH